MRQWKRVAAGHYTYLDFYILEVGRHRGATRGPSAWNSNLFPGDVNTLQQAKLVANKLIDAKTKVVNNLMSNKAVTIPYDTPLCCDPSSETYWSM